MTVSSSVDRATFVGNGVATVFPLPFRFFENAEINVWLIEDSTGALTPQSIGTHYTLVGAAQPELNGSPESELTMLIAPAVGFSLFVQRIIPATQPTDIVNQGKFFPEIHENVFDRLTMLCQQASGSISRALRVQESDPGPARIPSAANRSNKILSFDVNGDPVAIEPSSQSSLALRQDLSNGTDSTKGSSLVGFLPSGANYVSRTVQDKLRDSVAVGDYLDLAAAKTAAGLKTVVDPDGVSHKDTFNQSLAVFTEAVDAAWKGGEVHRASSIGAHSGVSRIAQSVEMRPEGSGDNGPSNADYGASISVIKDDFFNSTTRGEIDGLNITVRQGGRAVGGISDCAGILINVGTVHGTGWAGSIEAQTSTFNAITAAVQTQVQSAMGVLDSSTSSYYGFTTTANVGALGDAYFANSAGSASWTNFLRLVSLSGVDLFKVDGFGRIILKAGSGATPSKTIRALNGSLSVLNDAQTVQILALTDSGNLSVAGGSGAAEFIATGAASPQGPSTVVYGGTVAATANTGASGAPPAQVAGYIVCNIAGTQVKVPYYAN